ncbi:unnamed protein product [Pedinophyceae sp. YPF-701]|nr:unnamed protein product [Pedinophyceae sp. YPF-701]
MGRKGGGRKGFMKAAMAPGGDPEPEPQEASVQPDEAGVEEEKDDGAAAEREPSAEVDAQSEGEASAAPKKETLGQMKQRHKMEAKQLKDQAKKMGKKGKDQVRKLEAEMQERHERELASMEGGDDGVAEAIEAIASTSLYGAGGGPDGPKKQSKAMKKREKQHAEAKARDERIINELDTLGETERMAEGRALRDALEPKGLKIHDIPSDGHCLYRSIGCQLGDSATQPDHWVLRKQAAAWIREHPDDFLPFIAEDDAAGEPEERLETYCNELESTAAWGGHLELLALSCSLKRKIVVHSASAPEVHVGEDFTEEPPLLLCYLQHAFGLGQHYNAVVPAS